MLEELGPGSAAPARLRAPRPRGDGELRGLPGDARGARAVAPCRARALAQLAVPGRRGGRRALGPRGAAARAAARGRASAAVLAGGVGGRDRGDGRRLHAELVGRAAPSALRDARGQDRRPADERRPVGGARGAAPGVLRGSACRRDGSRARYLADRAAAAAGIAPVDELLALVEPAARELGTWELVEELRAPVEALRQLETGQPRRARRRSPPSWWSCREGRCARRSTRSGSSARGWAVAARPCSSSCSGSPRARRCFSAAARASSSPRTGPLRRRSSGSRTGQRSVRAVWFGLPGQSDEPQPALERRARAALRHAVDEDATALVLFRESTIAGSFAGLGGVERLGERVTLRSGRLPRAVHARSAARCCACAARAGCLSPQGMRLVEVGEAVLNDRVLFGDFLAPTDNALADAEVSPVVARAAGYHRPPPPPLFLAEGVETPRRAAGARRRSTAATPGSRRSRPGRPRLWEVDDLAAGRRARPVRAAGGFVELRPGRAGRGAARGAGDEPGRRPPARHRRRRGRGAPVRVRAPRGDDAANRSRGGPPPPRLVRRARLAARAADDRRGALRSRSRAPRSGWQSPRSWERSSPSAPGSPVGDVLDPQRPVAGGDRARAARRRGRDGDPRRGRDRSQPPARGSGSSTRRRSPPSASSCSSSPAATSVATSPSSCPR